MKKQLLILLFLALFVSLAYGIKIDESSINVIVDAKGNSLVEESYLVSFSDENEFNLFKENTQGDISIETLNDLGIDVYPRLEGSKPVILVEEQSGNTRIKMNYFSSSLFSIIKKTTFDEFTVSKSQFSFLFSGNSYVFPENFSLRFVFPAEAKINEKIIPETKITGKTVEWAGPVAAQDFFISFSIDKVPEPIEIKEINIEVKIEENGFGKMLEKYFLEFKDQDELEYFRKASEKNGTSPELWKTFDERFFPHVSANEYDVETASFKFEPNGLSESYLKLTYENESPLFIEQKEGSGRFVEWSLNQRKFDSFLSGGLIIIPENSVIEISLPLNAEIKENNLVGEEKGKIVWQGYESTSSIKVVYVMKENIAPSFNLSLTIQRIVSNKETLSVFIIALIVISLAVYIKREKISEKIDAFIIENSKVEHKEKEEIDIDS